MKGATEERSIPAERIVHNEQDKTHAAQLYIRGTIVHNEQDKKHAARTDESPRRRREAAVVATAPPLLCPASHTRLPALSCRQIRPRRLSLGPSDLSPGTFHTYDMMRFILSESFGGFICICRTANESITILFVC